MSKLILICTMFSSLPAWGALEPSISTQRETSYQKIKASIQRKTQEYKTNLEQIFVLNAELKSLNASRRRLSKKAENHDARAMKLAQEMSELKSELKVRRSELLKRLRAIYQFSRRDIGQILFSSQTLQDLDKNLSALKRISKSDLVVMKEYASRLEDLKKKDLKLNHEIDQLAKLQRTLATSERKLLEKQRTKASIMKLLRRANAQQLNALINLQNEPWFKTKFDGASIDKLTEVAFFETKGNLDLPIDGLVQSQFGVSIDPDYRFRIVNKGVNILSSISQHVKAVFKGTVAYVGTLPGHTSQGRFVILDHGDSYYTVYGALKSAMVEPGDEVKTHETIGRVDSKSKMYFEIRYYNEGINPTEWFTEKAELGPSIASAREVAQ